MMGEPIKLTYNTINEKVDDLVYRAVTEVGIEIDKDALVKALEKQMPKKVVYVHEQHQFMCPSCGNTLAFISGGANVTFCIHCGQAIDTSVDITHSAVNENM